MTQELLPCPFCGGETRIERSVKLSNTLPDVALVADHGDDCVLAQAGDFIPMHYTEAEAIAAWNTRDNQAAETERVAAFKVGWQAAFDWYDSTSETNEQEGFDRALTAIRSISPTEIVDEGEG